MPQPPAPLVDALRDRYAIQRELGRGGMATVYLARDLKHDRLVAVKVLRPELAAVLGGERFLREIRLTAQLQHPHILSLLDSGEAGGFLFYVMPYVEGESLRERLTRESQLPIDEALHITRGVAGALDYAHQRGVIHRDIKPENILLYQGEPMVADFGVALAAASAGRERLTETGLSLGTPAYMSPEQATADPKLDGRSDQYSLACVVYEMLAGEPPYTGPTAQTIIAKRLSEPVPHLSTVRAVPSAVEIAVSRALSRSPADRFPTIGQFVKALTDPGSAPRRRIQLSRRMVALVSAAAVLIAIAALGLISHSPPLTVARHRQITFSGNAEGPSISPDGHWIAYFASDTALMVQELSGTQPVMAARLKQACCTEPLWSLDGSTLFFSGILDRTDGHSLYAVGRLGGVVRKISSLPYESFSLHPDGKRFVYNQTMLDTIFTVDVATGELEGRIALAPHSYSAWRVPFAPNGQWIAFGGESAGVPFLGVVSPNGSKLNHLVDWVDRGAVRWSPHSDAIYFLQRVTGGVDLMKIRIDPRSGRRAGSPVRVMSYAPFGEFTIASDGKTLAYQKEIPSAHVWAFTISRLKRKRRVQARQVTSGTNTFGTPAISPDGNQVVFGKDEGGARNLYVTAYTGGTLRLIGPTRSDRFSPGWSSDGKHVVFAPADSSAPGVTISDVTGERPHRMGSSRIRSVFGTAAWSPDGKVLLYSADNPRQLVQLEIAGNREARLAAPDSAGWLYNPIWSPDGTQVAVAVITGDQGTLWRITLPSRRWSRIETRGGFIRPLLWASDGWIYFQNGRELRRVRPGAETEELYVTLPSDCRWSETGSLSRDASRFVCTLVERKPDIWVATNFDPDVR